MPSNRRSTDDYWVYEGSCGCGSVCLGARFFEVSNWQRKHMETCPEEEIRVERAQLVEL